MIKRKRAARGLVWYYTVNAKGNARPAASCGTIDNDANRGGGGGGLWLPAVALPVLLFCGALCLFCAAVLCSLHRCGGEKCVHARDRTLGKGVWSSDLQCENMHSARPTKAERAPTISFGFACRTLSQGATGQTERCAGNTYL